MLADIKAPQILVILLATIMLGLQSCQPPPVMMTDAGQPTTTPREIPTWTPRPARASSTPLTPTQTATIRPTLSLPQTTTPSLAAVTISAIGGNLNIRRGPAVDYNPISVLYKGETATATARDRVSRWLYISIPTAPGVSGWISTLTDYSVVTGSIESLPVVGVPSAVPAFIRNCTWHTVLVLPGEVRLRPKVEEPFNQERFSPGFYEVYDLDVSGEPHILQVDLREGISVDVRIDGAGDKSKCE